MRLRLYDARISELPEVDGLCASDLSAVAKLVNRAQRRLLYAREAGDEGWYGTFAEILFSGISRISPFITASRNIARIEHLTVCHKAVPVQNQFYEYLDFGNGRMPRLHPCDNWGVMQGYGRNNAVTFANKAETAQFIRIYSTSTADAAAGNRVLLQGFDQNGATIYSQDGEHQVQGEYLYLDTPFATSANQFTHQLQGIQKDITQGTLSFFAVDPATAEETLIHTMEPSEETAGYRRYYLNNLPRNCCSTGLSSNDCAVNNATLQIKAICKLELVPARVDQDWLLIQNLEALIEEAKSIHFSDMQDSASKNQANFHHLNAVRLLISELRHYYGKDEPAVQFRPFGSARLERLNVSMI